MAQDRIIIKASLENIDEIRRFSVDKASFAQIYETIKQLFSVQNSAPFAVQYKDPEGDLVVISNDLELIEALQVAKGAPLRVFIKLNLVDAIPAKVDVSPVNEKQKEKVSDAPVDNSYFGAKMRAAEEQRPLWKDFPEILESRERVKIARQKLIAAREQIASARKELVASRETFLSERKKLHNQVRAAREKRQAEKVHAVPEGPLKILARFVKHVTIPEDAELPPNTEFVKTWRFRNESNRPWPEARLLFVGKSVDDRLTDQNSFDVGSLAPGQEKDISIKMKTPALPGRYVSFWRLFDPSSKAKFGQRVCTRVNVIEKSPEEVDPDKKAFAGLLMQLQEMGFTDQEKNIRFIKRYNGNLSMVVQQLVKQLNESNGKQLRF